MKKKLTAFLLLITLLLASCSAAVEDVTSSPDDSSLPIELLPEWENRVQQLNALYGEEINRLDLSRILLSEGSTVTASRDGNGNLSLLTDGKELKDGTSEGTVKYAGKEDLALTMDMGSVKEDICDLGVGMLYATSIKGSLPKFAKFYVSIDGENYLLVGTAYRYDKIDNNTRSVIELRLQNKISARYIKVVIAGEDIISDNLYIDELYAYTYDEGEVEKKQDLTYDEYYQNTPLPEVTEDLYWDKSDADYDMKVNLVAGKSYRIKASMRIDSQYTTDYYNSPITNKALTDGRTGSNSLGDSAYFHFTRFVERTIYFDLEKISSISSVSVGFLRDTGAGIHLAESVAVLGSMDGKKWGVIATGTPTTTNVGVQRMTYTLDFDATKVRFVAVKIGLTSHLWMDELAVYGTKNVSEAKELEYKPSEQVYPNEYLSKDALGGIENIILMYNYKTENPASGLNSVEKQLLYAAYHDKDGNMLDTFFDSFLYLPCSTVTPSGGHLYYDSRTPSRASDWLDYEEDLFKENYNVPALSEAVSIMDETLGTDTEMSVFFSIFSTVYGDKGFGDIEGEINGVDFTDIEDRKKVIKWWIHHLIDRFESGEYGNLRLDGFYWYHEAIETSDPHEVELVKFTADYLHSLGYYFIWIPYYQSSGFMTWKSYGFDAAVMQPNYMFKDDVPESRLYDNANYTKMLGLGVEIEADYGVVSDPAKREKYRDYLRVGVETGYMNSIKMYYQDAGVYYSAYKSTDPYYHSVYDETYRYAKGTLTYGLSELEVTTFTGTQDKQLVIFPKAVDGSTLNVDVAMHPKYGTIRTSSNGRIYYYPAEGFVGEDTFVIRDASNEKDPGVVITVVIEKEAE